MSSLNAKNDNLLVNLSLKARIMSDTYLALNKYLLNANLILEKPIQILQFN